MCQSSAVECVKRPTLEYQDISCKAVVDQQSIWWTHSEFLRSLIWSSEPFLFFPFKVRIAKSALERGKLQSMIKSDKFSLSDCHPLMEL